MVVTTGIIFESDNSSFSLVIKNFYEMEILNLHLNPMTELNKNLHKRHSKISGFLAELRDLELSQEIISSINAHVRELNNFGGSSQAYSRLLRKKQWKIVTILEKELKIVPKNYYRNLWMILGMTSIGVPLGMVLGISVHNMGLMGVGFPVGMAIGIAIGAAKDKKAKESGKQLNFEMI